MKKVRLIALAVVVVAAGLGGWFATGRRAVHAAVPVEPAAVPITAGVAKAEDVPIFAQGLGAVQAISTVNVKSRVDGEIEKVFFAEGQEVKQNDPLFLIDPRPYQAALAQAEATADKDRAQLEGAQLDLARFGKLVGSGYQSRQSYDDEKAVVAQFQAATKADQAAIQTAKLNLQYAVIRAPISGRTGKLMVDQGNLVQASAGTTLVSLTQIKPIYVNFPLPQALLDQIRQVASEHVLDVDAYDGNTNAQLAQGKLSFIDNHVDTATGTIDLEASFANADERLWPGEFVSVRLILGTRHDAVTVPAATVMTGSDGEYVYVIKPNDTVQRRAVSLLARQDGIAVIGKGLAAGERVVIAGQYRLANNVRVKTEAAQRPAG